MTPEINDLIGKTVTEIHTTDDTIEFTCETGERYKMYHSQDCCEHVYIEDICGDLQDLIGSPMLLAEEVSSDKHPDGFNPEYPPESFTWTFYKFSTNKGSVTVRFYGSSNGYYSESASFVKLQ
jgi:hypothetical protein